MYQYLLLYTLMSPFGSPMLLNAALTRGLKLAGAEGPVKRGTSVSNGLVGAAVGEADRDMDPSGATPQAAPTP